MSAALIEIKRHVDETVTALHENRLDDARRAAVYVQALVNGIDAPAVEVKFTECLPRQTYIDHLHRIIQDIEHGGLVGVEMDPAED